MARHYFPWVALRPWSWRIYYACPEIRWHLNETSKRRAVFWFWSATVGLLAVMLFAVGAPLMWVAGRLFDTQSEDDGSGAIRKAHQILPVNEIRRRMGKEPLPEPTRYRSSE